MVLSADFSSHFPPAPPHAASWTPIYFEPLPGSGERLTIAVIAVDGAGDYAMISTFDERAAKCLYGKHAKAVIDQIAIATDSLRAHLTERGALDAWQSPPIDAVTRGSSRSGFGDSLAAIAQSGVELTSSVGACREHDLLSMDELDTSLEPPPISDWEREIKRVALTVRDWPGQFGQDVQVTRNARKTHISYLGEKIAANFDRLDPKGKFTPKIHRAKSRLIDLQILRDQHDGFVKRNHYELLLWKPPKGTPVWDDAAVSLADEAFAELQSFGDTHELRVRAVADTQAVIRRLQEAE